MRIRPRNSTDEEGGKFIWKESPDSLLAGGIRYNFSSVFGSGSTQVWRFHISHNNFFFLKTGSSILLL